MEALLEPLFDARVDLLRSRQKYHQVDERIDLLYVRTMSAVDLLTKCALRGMLEEGDRWRLVVAYFHIRLAANRQLLHEPWSEHVAMCHGILARLNVIPEFDRYPFVDVHPLVSARRPMPSASI